MDPQTVVRLAEQAKQAKQTEQASQAETFTGTGGSREPLVPVKGFKPNCLSTTVSCRQLLA